MVIFFTAAPPSGEQNKEHEAESTAAAAAAECELEATDKDNGSDPHARSRSCSLADDKTDTESSTTADLDQELSGKDVQEETLTTTTDDCKTVEGSSVNDVDEKSSATDSAIGTIAAVVGSSTSVSKSSEKIETDSSPDTNEESCSDQASVCGNLVLEDISDSQSRADEAESRPGKLRESSVKVTKPASKVKGLLSRMFPCIFKQASLE